MMIRESIGKSLLTLVLCWTFLFSTLPVRAQGDFVTSSDISGGSSVFVFRNSRKAKKRNFVARRRSKAKRTVKQRRSTRRKVVRQSKTVAKRYRKRRTIKKISPEEFQRQQITIKRKTAAETSKILAGAAEYFIEEESNLEKAAEYLEEAITLDATNIDAQLAFSELSVTLGDKALDQTDLSREIRFRKAQSFFEQALKYDAKNALAYVGIAQVYDEQDKDAEALENYEKALKLDPSLSEVKAALSFLYYGEGRIDEADTMIGEALADGEDNPEIQYFLGLIKYKKGEDAQAETALRKSIALDTENAEAHYYLGAVLARMGKSAAAIKSFETSTTLDPKFVNAWFDLGVEYYNNERYQEAVNAFNTSVADNPNNTEELSRIYGESFANLAETYRQTGQYDEAISKYRIAVGLITDDADLFSTYGFVLGSKKRWKDAITAFQNAVDINPDSINYGNLGWAHLKSGLDNREIRFFDREKVDLTNAKAALEKSVQLDNEQLAANLNLGTVLNDLGEFAGAAKALRKAVEIQDDWQPANFELGEAYLGLRDYKKAEDQFEKILRKDKKHVYAYFNLARAQHLRGDKKEARKTQKSLQKLDARMAGRLETFFIRNPVN